MVYDSSLKCLHGGHSFFSTTELSKERKLCQFLGVINFYDRFLPAVTSNSSAFFHRPYTERKKEMYPSRQNGRKNAALSPLLPRKILSMTFSLSTRRALRRPVFRKTLSIFVVGGKLPQHLKEDQTPFFYYLSGFLLKLATAFSVENFQKST